MKFLALFILLIATLPVQAQNVATEKFASETVVKSTTVIKEKPVATIEVVDEPVGEMANTGGEPELLLMSGLLLASGGIMLRKHSSQSA